MEIITRSRALELGLKRFFTGKACKNGHMSERSTSNYTCLSCKAEAMSRKYKECELTRSRAIERTQMWKKDNPDGYKDWAIANRKSLNEKSLSRYHEKMKDDDYREQLRSRGRRRSKNRTDEQREKSRTYCKLWRDKNKDKAEYKNKKTASDKAYRKKNPEIIFIRRCFARLLTPFNGDRGRYEEAIGYTASDLREHIEANFSEGMTWDNHGDWHIDHIKPISLFIKEGVIDVKIIHALSNLQPLWKFDNLSKGSKYQEPRS